MTRRDLLLMTLGGFAPRASAKGVIFIEMAGGPSHVDTFDLKVGPWTPSWMAPVRSGDVQFPSGLMPRLAEMLDRIVLVRGIEVASVVHPRNAVTGPLPRATAASFGEACAGALARVRGGARSVTIRLGSWDHHGNLYQQLRLISRAFDDGVASLIRRAGDGVKIVAMGEFGRRPGPLNQNGGRDHYPVHAALMAGGGIVGGRAIGRTDCMGEKIVERPCEDAFCASSGRLTVRL
jgi:hypothetical protein